MRLGAVILTLALVADVSARARPPLRVAFLGSSAAAGAGAARPDRRWSTILARSQGWDELNLGLSGSWLSNTRRPGVPSALERVNEIITMRADALFFMYGANEIAAQVPVEEFEAEVRVIFRLLWNQRVVVVTPQPTEALSTRRGPYDDVLRRAAREAGFGFIDGAAAVDPAALPTLSNDGLQLNDLGHARLAEQIAAGLVPPRGQGAAATTR